MNTPDYIALVAIVVAIATLIWTSRAQVLAHRLESFTVYTARYQAIMLALPCSVGSVDFRIENLDSDHKNETIKNIRAYFDLCSEEFFLSTEGWLNKTVWSNWKSGITAMMARPAFREGWERLRSEQYYAGDFADFIDGLVNQA